MLSESKSNNNATDAAATALGLSTSEAGVGLAILAAVAIIYTIDQATKPPIQWYTPPTTTIADPGAGYRNLKTEDSAEEETDVNGVKVPDDGRTSDDPLRKSKHGHAEEDPEAAGTHHTQLGTRQGRKGAYRQGREFKNGEPEWDYDMTDHGRPQNHPNPHKHKWHPNPIGGAKSRGKTALPID